MYAIAAGVIRGASVFALNSTNGEQVWQSGFTTQGSPLIDAPIVSGDRLISHGGQQGGLVSLDAATGAMQRLSDGLFQSVDYFQTGSVAAAGEVLYAVVPNGAETPLELPVLRGYERATGTRLYSIETSLAPAPVNLREPSPTPVVTGPSSVVVSYQYNPDSIRRSRLERFDTQSRSVSWFVDSNAVGSFAHDPVFANGVVYVANTPLNRVEARSEADGTLLWSWTPPAIDQSRFDFPGGRLIVTDNLLAAHVETAKRTTVQSRIGRHRHNGS